MAEIELQNGCDRHVGTTARNHKGQSSKFNVQSQGPYMRSSGSPYQPFTHQFGHEALPVHIENSRQLELF